MSRLALSLKNVNSLTLRLPVRTKMGKAVPARIDYQLRRLMMDEDDPRFRTRVVDSTIEAEHIMRKADDFSKEDRIVVPKQADLTRVNGVPEEHQSTRRVRIYIPAQSVTQSGNHDSRLWRLDFDNRERWENPLMGWASSGDPLSNVSVEFETPEAAVDFCQRQGWPCYVEEPSLPKMRIKSYGANFSWNKRTRVGTK
ncbi:NADH dehydrogenase Fe-S protein subunit 4 ndufs4 [Clonorchis sinensis]|uniref:NADH dehydrogenase [ubiquinone] iron-sulfur protein 4, mitochondrial n=2 Tax=Clonorchis sinensis TaxID=79923 RepID=H2KVT9_CLOSI|nr:NADH dehydrogenase Fe-S protein subunit 4 ndufs4 [Clonorchis sinensis]GAA43169.1 NADH dehydrogenase [ubiquinone] iron-sulfur protein 4 mitochondrial [Clonorchis sinensis]